MCGIAGVANSMYGTSTDRFVRDALVAGMLRGMDSTGIMQVDRNGKIYYVKEAVEGLFFLGNKVARQFIDDTCKSAITVTHTRAATQGKVNDDNAHPFVAHKGNAEPLVGVHNGSLTPAWRTKPGAKDFEVDSQWALAHIAARGPEAFKDINGPFAFVWAEADKKGKLFMARNSQRPMHILFTEDRKSMLFASEAGMLSWLAERSNIKTQAEILSLVPDYLYEFDTNGTTVTFTKTLLPKQTYAPAVVPAKPTGTTIIGTPPTVSPLSSYTASAKLLNESGEAFIANIKLAAQGKLPVKKDVTPFKQNTKELGAAATTAAGKGEVVTGQRDDDAPFLEDNSELVPLNWFSPRLTKADERAHAIKIGFFRELQWFSGVAFDDQSGELLGDIEVYDRKNGKQTYTAVLRGISPARAHNDYIDNGGPRGMKEGGWVVITGSYADPLLGTVFVATEMNMIGKTAMIDKAKKAH